jgi:hypothetical protein
VVVDGSTTTENVYTYDLFTPTTATVLATANGQPLITKNKVGLGSVYLVTADWFLDANKTKLLSVVQKLFDMLYTGLAPVQVSGPSVVYLVIVANDKIIVTVVNTSFDGAPWNGTIAFNQPTGSYTTKEYC